MPFQVEEIVVRSRVEHARANHPVAHRVLVVVLALGGPAAVPDEVHLGRALGQTEQNNVSAGQLSWAGRQHQSWDRSGE